MESIPIKTEKELKVEVEKIYQEMIKKPEVVEALVLLDQLPENLKYHNKAHTLDVIRETILFTLADGQSGEVIDLEVIAAAWHDVGYVKRYKNNEPVAIELFKQSKTFQSLSPEDRQKIIDNILDTQLIVDDGKPKLLNSMSNRGYLLDADVSNFGREDYFENSKLIAEELGIDWSNIEARKKFLTFALELLVNHDWKTRSAKALRQKQKEINIKKLEEQLK